MGIRFDCLSLLTRCSPVIRFQFFVEVCRSSFLWGMILNYSFWELLFFQYPTLLLPAARQEENIRLQNFARAFPVCRLFFSRPHRVLILLWMCALMHRWLLSWWLSACGMKESTIVTELISCFCFALCWMRLRTLLLPIAILSLEALQSFVSRAILRITTKAAKFMMIFKTTVAPFCICLFSSCSWFLFGGWWVGCLCEPKRWNLVLGTELEVLSWTPPGIIDGDKN